MTEGDGEKGVGAGVPGTELLAMPSSPPQEDSPARRASGCRVWCEEVCAGFGVGTGVAGV